jgi:hypothetical protein
LRRLVLFWRGRPRPAAADESLAALLARRDQVRSTQTAPAQPSPELFQPRRPGAFGGKESPVMTVSPKPEAAEMPEPGAKPEEKPLSTTGRLLDAKRRAKKKME